MENLYSFYFLTIEQDFKEVWLHENCAIWNPSIFIKENQVFGIAKCLKTASEMVFIYII